MTALRIISLTRRAFHVLNVHLGLGYRPNVHQTEIPYVRLASQESIFQTQRAWTDAFRKFVHVAQLNPDITMCQGNGEMMVPYKRNSITLVEFVVKCPPGYIEVWASGYLGLESNSIAHFP